MLYLSLSGASADQIQPDDTFQIRQEETAHAYTCLIYSFVCLFEYRLAQTALERGVVYYKNIV